MICIITVDILPAVMQPRFETKISMEDKMATIQRNAGLPPEKQNQVYTFFVEKVFKKMTLKRQKS